MRTKISGNSIGIQIENGIECKFRFRTLVLAFVDVAASFRRVSFVTHVANAFQHAVLTATMRVLTTSVVTFLRDIFALVCAGERAFGVDALLRTFAIVRDLTRFRTLVDVFAVACR